MAQEKEDNIFPIGKHKPVYSEQTDISVLALAKPETAKLGAGRPCQCEA